MHLPISLPQLKNKLIQENLISSERFDALVVEAERKNEDILDVLTSEKIVAEDYLNDFFASSLGVELANLSSKKFDEKAVRMLPEDIARQRHAVVFGQEPDGTLDVAMADPSDLETIEFLTERLKSKIKPYLAKPDDLNLVFSVYGLDFTQNFEKVIEGKIQESLKSRTKSVEEAATQLPIVEIVDSILSYALSLRASDVHLEILEENTLVRYRIDGMLYEILKIPKVVHPTLVARIKILAGLKLDEHYKPQDGRFRHQIANQLIDVRVSSIPTFYGEKIEMRLLVSAGGPLSFEELGIHGMNAKIVSENLKAASGMILSCGPTGSGKTTTLYTMMNILNKPTVNVVTIEDPIEYNIRYVNQTQINPAAGITFAAGLRSLLRQDPNIIMVGEIRDRETADIAVEAALTGHLILSSLHTNDAPTAIPRLFDLGILPFLAAATLNLVLAQRLVRRICPNCVYSYEITPAIKETIAKQLQEIGVKTETEIPKLLFQGKGCSSCNSVGYQGRLGIFEALEITDKIRKAIVEPQFNPEAVRQEARADGFKTMFEDGLNKIQLGLTTIEEVLRVIRE